jgi:exosortase family protein XrtM
MKSILKNLKAEWDAKYPVLRFFTLFAILMGLFYLGISTPFFKNNLFPAYLQLLANISGGIISGLGHNVSIEGASVISSRFAIEIVHGCDAIQPSALFASAVLAFPAPWLLKLPGFVIGTLFLFMINLIRIVSLFFVGVYYPQAFSIMHIEIWQPLFILLAMLFFVFWLIWATQRQRIQQHAPD